MRILAIIGSPRGRANTSILLRQLLAGAEAEGATAEVITPAKMQIAPCIACEGCFRDGRCVVMDDYQNVYDMIRDSDALVLATPIFFGAVSGQVKPLIDRCQCYWALREVVRAPMPPSPAGTRERKGVLISVSGIDSMKMFEGARTTFRFLMRSLQGRVWAELLYPGVEGPAEIQERPAALERAYTLGRRLALGQEAEGS